GGALAHRRRRKRLGGRRSGGWLPLTPPGGRERGWLRLVRTVDLELDQRRADGALFADLAVDRDDPAGARRGKLDRRLVGHHLDEGVVLLDEIAGLDVPGDDLGLGGAFAGIRQLDDLAGHVSAPSPGGYPRRPVSGRGNTPIRKCADRACPSRSPARSAPPDGRSNAPAPAPTARRRSRWCASPRGR